MRIFSSFKGVDVHIKNSKFKNQLKRSKKHSKFELRKNIDSKEITYRYTTTNYKSHVKFLLEKDRAILREINAPEGADTH